MESFPEKEGLTKGPLFAQEDFKSLGLKFVDIDPKIAQALLRAAHLPEEQISSLLKEAAKSEVKPPVMASEEKKGLYEGMAEEFQRKSEKAVTDADKAKYTKLAEVYRKAVEALGADKEK